MSERKDAVSEEEKNLLRTLQQIDAKGVRVFKPYNLTRIKGYWGSNYDLPFQSLSKLAISDPTPAELLLVDTTVRPESLDGGSIYKDDPFSEVIEKLRREGHIRTSSRVSLGSRLDLSYDEIQRFVLPDIADMLGVDRSQVRVPKLIENALLLPFYPEFEGRSEIWEWYADRTKSWWF